MLWKLKHFGIVLLSALSNKTIVNVFGKTYAVNGNTVRRIK